MKKSLYDLLHTYKSLDRNEILFRADMIKFLYSYGKEAFKNETEYGHFTGSCWLVNKAGDAALLTHHTKLGRWFQLGGHCDGSSDILSVAIREAQEESGIKHIESLSTDIFDIDIHTIPANSKMPEHLHYDVRFILKVMSDEQVVCSNESKELRWITKDGPLPTDLPSVVRMFNKWCSRY